ncbi:L30e-like protein [Ophiobolus disseminans]|uniref:L30e-like protein n=1 Tax=Ophiobolus disseminans TaxID=1469910 RepID=A0A6A6ZZY4_9PLEO|nr:L30e-like protein [Ophiobolus disseminans]
MAKEIEEKKLKKEKRDKKDKKEKRAETDGVTKSKKDKKEKKVHLDTEMVDALEAELEKAPEVALVKVVDGDEGDEPRGALVPFAFPLADDTKEIKKILKTVKKSAKTKTLRRGVKEVVKALRKSQSSGPASSDPNNPSAIVVIAADISPMDVISHIPVLCEDHSIPYIYIKSRAQLGEASATKRPTSVVMISKDRTTKSKKDVKDEDVEEFAEVYAELQKLVAKASKSVRK